MGDRVAGKVAVVTGGSAGIGLAIAEKLAAEGAFVFITGRRQAELDAAANGIGASCRGIQADSTKMADLDRLYEKIGKVKDRIDILVVNAGGGQFARLGSITEEQFDWQFNLNVKGVLFTVQKALPLLVDGASIILTGSTAGTTGTKALSVYAAAKAAVRNFARSWIQDLQSRKIRVNVLTPGAIRTPGLTKHAPDEEQLKTLLGNLAGPVPLKRVGEAEEVAEAALFLASDASSYVTGNELFVDGGAAQI